MHERLIIAGPCAAESEDQVMKSTEAAAARGINVVRMSLWKPRTKPGFDGVGEKGIPWLINVSEMGLTPATEVMFPSHAEATVNAIIKNTSGRIILWLGSRNQNHLIQQDISRVIAGEPRVMLMIKNQPWRDEAHWEGIVDHVLSGGAKEEQLLLCHRGFAPGSNELRNSPDYAMALRLKLKRNLPVILDSSHIGGSVKNVLAVSKQGMQYRENGVGFDGLMVEVHPNPKEALTDSKQQLDWQTLDQLLTELY